MKDDCDGDSYNLNIPKYVKAKACFNISCVSGIVY